MKEEIRKAREKSSGIIGVNVMVAMSNFADMVKTAIQEKADIINKYAEGKPLKAVQLDLAKEALGISGDIPESIIKLAAEKKDVWITYKDFLAKEMLTATPEEIQQMTVLPGDLPMITQYELN